MAVGWKPAARPRLTPTKQIEVGCVDVWQEWCSVKKEKVSLSVGKSDLKRWRSALCRSGGSK